MVFRACLAGTRLTARPPAQGRLQVRVLTEALVQLNSEASEAPPSFKEILKAEARVLNTGTQRSLKNLILQEGVFTSVLGLCCVISQPSAEEGNQIHFSLERSTISRPNRWGWSLFFPLSLLLGPVFPF